MQLKRFLLSVTLFAALYGCGNMSHNTNEDHSHEESSPIDSMNPVGSPNTSTVPMRDTFDTDSFNNTQGPDNAIPKASGRDTSRSIR